MDQHVQKIKIAEQIIELDLKRDELFEELLNLIGSKSYEFLRSIQNQSNKNYM
jgi:hypothetical protein